MADVTIQITDELMTVVPGKLPKSILAFSSAGLFVYTLGKSRYHHEDAVRNLALSEATLRHIPLISFRDRRYKGAAKKGIDTQTRDMFSSGK